MGKIARGLSMSLDGFIAGPSEQTRSRFHSNTGDTLDYVYEPEGTIPRSGPKRGLPRSTTGAGSAPTEILSPAPGNFRGAVAMR